ncbi:MAG TPA: hypothetical protein VN801_01125 [Candidatus Udaeobacter sp.]|nr:hypothetical protein [Candidatus Udaeobacter sp.]
MKVFRILQLLVLGLAAFLMQGCPPLGSTEFINNTGRPITIHYAEKTVSVVQGASTTIRGYTWPESFDIDTPRRTWHYMHPSVGRDFMYPTFDVVLRVDRDGRVYAFQTADASKKSSGQPPGHPLHPKA